MHHATLVEISALTILLVSSLHRLARRALCPPLVFPLAQAGKGPRSGLHLPLPSRIQTPVSPRSIIYYKLALISLAFSPCSCNTRSTPPLWATLAPVRDRILGWAMLGTDKDGSPIGKGQRVQAIKFLQRAVLVQTKGPNDPRVGSTLLPSSLSASCVSSSSLSISPSRPASSRRNGSQPLPVSFGSPLPRRL